MGEPLTAPRMAPRTAKGTCQPCPSALGQGRSGCRFARAVCGCGCLSYHLLCKPILSLQPRLTPRNPELAAQFSGPPGCLALRLPWTEGSGSPLASHPARTVTQRDVSQIAGDSTSHSRRLRSSDLGAAADSARKPAGITARDRSG